MKTQKAKKILFYVLTATAVAGLVFSSASASAATKTSKTTKAAKAKAKPKPALTPRRADGIPDQKSRANFWPVAVMIDNHTAARPQSGLQQASFVYETLAEGGIPRFMAIFADMNVKHIGPVRSTRPYFVQYAVEWHAAVAHAGGSPDGWKKLEKFRMVSIFGIKGQFAKLFYRAFGGGVHGLYTNSANLMKALKTARVWNKKPNYDYYRFKVDTDTKHRGPSGSGVYIDLGYGKLYDASYTYDQKRNAYLRFTGSRAHMDRLTRKQITVKNIVIINVPKEKVLDRKGRLAINVVGKGTGYLLQNGKKYKITWKKPKETARTRFYMPDKTEVRFVRGNTWIEIVPKGHPYSFR